MASLAAFAFGRVFGIFFAPRRKCWKASEPITMWSIAILEGKHLGNIWKYANTPSYNFNVGDFAGGFSSTFALERKNK